MINEFRQCAYVQHSIQVLYAAHSKREYFNGELADTPVSYVQARYQKPINLFFTNETYVTARIRVWGGRGGFFPHSRSGRGFLSGTIFFLNLKSIFFPRKNHVWLRPSCPARLIYDARFSREKEKESFAHFEIFINIWCRTLVNIKINFFLHIEIQLMRQHCVTKHTYAYIQTFNTIKHSIT